jgi:hypothetical protein
MQDDVIRYWVEDRLKLLSATGYVIDNKFYYYDGLEKKCRYYAYGTAQEAIDSEIKQIELSIAALNGQLMNVKALTRSE